MHSLFARMRRSHIAIGACFMISIAGCSSSPSQPHINLAPADSDLRIVYLNEAEMLHLSTSEPGQLHTALEAMRKQADLTDDIHFSVQQMLARGALYGNRWSEYFSQELIFYVEGVEQLQPRMGIEVLDASGQRINRGYQIIPADHLLQITLSQHKHELDDSITVRIAHGGGDTVEFILEKSVFSTEPL